MSHAPQVLAYLAAVNGVTFLTFGRDKRAAIAGDRRVRERTLLGLADLGGGLGAIAAQRVFRHKTRKEPFRTLLFLILAAQAAGLLVLAPG